MFRRLGAAGCAVILAVGAGTAAERDVQIRSVNFATGVVELHNFGATDEPLDGWRFCTHDAGIAFQYSGPAGFNGVTIEAGTSVFLHYNDDAGSDPDHFDASELSGAFAFPLDFDAYGMQIYFPNAQGFVNFGDPSLMADHLQWSESGADDASADERSDEAQNAGLWNNQDEWIATTADTQRIVLLDDTGGTAHGPEDYLVSTCSTAGCDNGDLNGDCSVGLDDLSILLGNFGGPGDREDGDTDGDGDVDLTDLSRLLGQYGSDCS